MTRRDFDYIVEAVHTALDCQFRAVIRAEVEAAVERAGTESIVRRMVREEMGLLIPRVDVGADVPGGGAA